MRVHPQPVLVVSLLQKNCTLRGLLCNRLPHLTHCRTSLAARAVHPGLYNSFLKERGGGGGAFIISTRVYTVVSTIGRGNYENCWLDGLIH